MLPLKETTLMEQKYKSETLSVSGPTTELSNCSVICTEYVEIKLKVNLPVLSKILLFKYS